MNFRGYLGIVKKRILIILLSSMFLIILVLFISWYDRAANANNKFDEFERHFKDAQDRRLIP